MIYNIMPAPTIIKNNDKSDIFFSDFSFPNNDFSTLSCSDSTSKEMDFSGLFFINADISLNKHDVLINL